MNNRVFKVGELRKVLSESSQEFKPVLGSKVESEDRKNNSQSYKEIEKETSKVKGNAKPEDRKVADPFEYMNQTPLHFNPATEPSKEWKERVKAQVEGNENGIGKKVNDEESGVSTKGNKEIYKGIKKSVDDINAQKTERAHNGLTARMNDKKGYEKPKMTESSTPKRLVFKYTRFINETQMLSRIPEEYKKDGQVIHMVDKLGNEYIVECEKTSTGHMETNIKGFVNRKTLNEQVDRINQLMNYEVGDNHRDNVRNTHINESTDFSEMMDIARKITK